MQNLLNPGASSPSLRPSMPSAAQARGGSQGTPVGGQASRGSAPLEGTPDNLEVNFLSLLADSEEEFSVAFASKVHERKLGDRKLRDSGVDRPDPARMRQLLEAFAGGGDKGKSGQGNPEGRVKGLARKVLARPSGTGRLVREEAGSDPTAQYVMLLALARHFEDGDAGSDPGGQGHAAVVEALEELAAQHGPAIRADINTVDATRGMAPTQAGAFRSAYKDAVLGSESLADVGKLVLKATQGDSGEAFLKTLNSMMSALGLDLAATRASAEPAKLKALLSDIHNLEILATVVDRCGALSGTLQRRHGAPPIKSTALASDMVALSGERWMDSGRIRRIGDQHGAGHSPSTAVDLLTGMRDVFRELPVWAFQSPEARDSMITAAQDAVDTAIDQEEGVA